MAEQPTTDEHDAIADFLVNLREVSADLVHRTIGANRHPESLAALVEGANAIADLAMARLAAMLPAEHPIECGRQCSHCCTLALVMTDPATALYISGQVSQRFEATRLDAWKARLAAVSRRPCALLEDDICTVYSDRPVICRAFNAYDSSACEAGNLPDLGGAVGERAYPVPYAIAASMARGMAEAMDALHLHGRQVELNAALRIAAADPGAVQRWLDGEDVFGEEHREPEPEPAEPEVAAG